MKTGDKIKEVKIMLMYHHILKTNIKTDVHQPLRRISYFELGTGRVNSV